MMFLMSPWIQQLGRLQYQAPPASLTQIKVTLILGSRLHITPRPSSAVLMYCMKYFIFIWIYLFKFQKGCIVTLLLTRVITIHYQVHTLTHRMEILKH